MPKITVDQFILNNDDKAVILNILREIMLAAGMGETVKWGMPVYTVQGRNVLGIGAFKKYVSVWFFKGALLADTEKKLVHPKNPGTNSMKYFQFHHEDEIDADMVLSYVSEAMQNEIDGKKIPPAKPKKLVVPVELQNAMKEDTELKQKFEAFSPSGQREFADYVGEAKREETRLNRLEKIIPMILDKKGLNDKYKKK